MRNLRLTRSEAEWLIDLLDKNSESDNDWMAIMSNDLRGLFGMLSREQEFNQRQIDLVNGETK